MNFKICMFCYADNNVTQYSFVEGNEDHMFGLNHSDGRIFVMRELRYIQKSVSTFIGLCML